jgi:hypothetical protein
MGILAPIERYDNAATGLGMAPPPKQGLNLTGKTSDESAVRYGLGLQRKIMDGLKAIFNAPGADALIGGPWAAGALGATLFHGSPHTFSKFDMGKVGTGEGNAAFGHGLYFAESPNVAKQYAEAVPNIDFQRKVREVYDETSTPGEAVEALKQAGLSPAQLRLVDALRKDDWFGFDYPHQAVRAAMREPHNFDPSPETLDAIKGLSNVYRVDVPDEAIGMAIDWDKPLSQQAPGVQKSIKSIIAKLPQDDPEVWFYNQRKNADPQGRDIYRMITSVLGKGEAEASQYLRDNGIQGIKYLDNASRKSGQGTYNYVLFDDGIPKIVGKEK